MTMQTLQPRLSPIEEMAKDKTDVLDWEAASATVSNLEFRPPFVVTWAGQFSVLTVLTMQSATAIAVAWLLATFVAAHIARWEFAVVVVMAAAIWASARQVYRHRQPPSSKADRVGHGFCVSLITPLYTYVSIALLDGLRSLDGAFMYLAVALPILIIAADRLATHTIYWTTADLRIDHNTKELLRLDWSRRFFGPSRVLQHHAEQGATNQQLLAKIVGARDAYCLGPLWLLAAFVLPTGLILAINASGGPTTLGLQLVVGGLFGLSAAALLRSGGSVSMIARCWKSLLHFSEFDRDTRRPPWMFHSPYGPFSQRRWLTMAAVGLLSIVCAGLTTHSAASLVSLYTASAGIGESQTPKAGASNNLNDNQKVPDGSRWKYVVTQLAVILIAGMVCIPLAVLEFLLAGLVLIGPVIDAYHEAIES